MVALGRGQKGERFEDVRCDGEVLAGRKFSMGHRMDEGFVLKLKSQLAVNVTNGRHKCQTIVLCLNSDLLVWGVPHERITNLIGLDCK